MCIENAVAGILFVGLLLFISRLCTQSPYWVCARIWCVLYSFLLASDRPSFSTNQINFYINNSKCTYRSERATERERENICFFTDSLTAAAAAAVTYVSFVVCYSALWLLCFFLLFLHINCELSYNYPHIFNRVAAANLCMQRHNKKDKKRPE